MNVPSSVCENVDNGVSRGDVCGARASDPPRVCARERVWVTRESVHAAHQRGYQYLMSRLLIILLKMFAHLVHKSRYTD